MSELNKTEKPTIEDIRKYWGHERAVSGHKAAFAGAVLLTLGAVAVANVDDAKEYVDYRDRETSNGIRYAGVSHEHTLSSVSLIGGSVLSFLGAFGFAVRAGNRYTKSVQHRRGDKDPQYDPRSYDA